MVAERGVALPFEFFTPAGKRQERKIIRAQRDFTCEAVADIACGVCIDIVECRGGLVGEALKKLMPIACPIDTIKAAKLIAWFVRGPLKSENFLSRDIRDLCEIADDRAVASEADLLLNFPSSPYGYFFLFVSHSYPLAPCEIKIRLCWVDFLPVEIAVVTDRCGHPPGDPAIVTELDARRAWNRGAPHLEVISLFVAGGSLEMHEVPDRRERHSQMGVVA